MSKRKAAHKVTADRIDWVSVPIEWTDEMKSALGGYYALKIPDWHKLLAAAQTNAPPRSEYVLVTQASLAHALYDALYTLRLSENPQDEPRMMEIAGAALDWGRRLLSQSGGC